MDLVLAVVGLVLLLVAGDLLVRGAVGLSARLGVPALIIGLSVVAFGTSAPELLVSVQAALIGAPAIAVGNVVGSNIANVLLVLGLPAIIAAIDPGGENTRRSFVLMIGATVLVIGLCFLGPLVLWHALVLLVCFALVLADMARAAYAGALPVPDDVEGVDPRAPLWKVLGLLVLGLVGLPLGADLLIDGAVGIATRFGISEAVIGLTLVAVGTSLPELATTMVAAIRDHLGVAFGNVIGSNLFNILLILGVTSLFGPVDIDPEFLSRDLWVMLAASLLLLPVVFRGWRITRLGGIALLAGYVAFTYVLFVY